MDTETTTKSSNNDIKFNRGITIKNFNETADALTKTGIDISKINPSQVNFNYSDSSGKVTCLEPDVSKQKLMPSMESDIETRNIFAYDESIRKYSALEGEAYFTCHSLIKICNDDYINRNLITLHFMTSAKQIHELNKYIIFAKDHAAEYSKTYARDRATFITENIEEHSILFVDGPIIGGQISEYNRQMTEMLLSKNVISIFLVKNSASKMVIENHSDMAEKYNSDIHWSNKLLLPGERSPFFKYIDPINPRLNKVFCYIKGLENIPMRLEMHGNVYDRYLQYIPSIMNMVYYMILAQGTPSNPQLRPIAVAEMYGRELLKYLNINEMLENFKITPSINQERFG